MRERLARFMVGRYGSDQFSRFLSVAALVLIAANLFIKGTAASVLSLLVWLLLIYSIYRVFSRNIYRRQAENRWYLENTAKIRAWLFQQKNRGQQRKAQHQQRKTHVFFTCPKCQAQLRVPRGQGKIEITCSRCKHKLIGKT